MNPQRSSTDSGVLRFAVSAASGKKMVKMARSCSDLAPTCQGVENDSLPGTNHKEPPAVQLGAPRRALTTWRSSACAASAKSNACVSVALTAITRFTLR
ncbi:hypothetical protein L596_003147 [Steinernema carpocapsae]|uniref:Uncharacterized protein n=1 Tax=Steinernema carpocapsae TaxID=34508 RepID=A0A4U8URT3_STECR|nr:hypothetical protein L596_003147 [Steinernema carpocapsae]